MVNQKSYLINKGYSSADANAIVVKNEAALKTWNESLAKQVDAVSTKSFWQNLNDIGTGIGFDRTSASDFRLLATYVNNDVVHTCVSMNSNQVSSTAFSVYREAVGGNAKGYRKAASAFRKMKGNRSKLLRVKTADVDIEELPDAPLLDLLANANEDLDATDFISLTATYVQLFGKAFWHLERNNPADVPSEIKILKPYYVFPQRDLEGNVTGYYYTNVSNAANAQHGVQYDSVFLEKENVIDFRYPAPSDPFGGGDSPLRSAFVKVATSAKFNDVLSDMLSNRARIDGILSTGSDMAPDAREKLEKDFNAKFKESGNGGVFVPDSPNVKFTPVQYSPTDLAPLEINDALKVAVANALHVPISLIDADPKYSNLESSKELWARNGILPLISLIESKINKYLSPLFDDVSFFAFENPVPEDEEFILEQKKADDAVWVGVLQYAPQYITPNELRGRLGLDDIEGGDELPPPTAPVNPTPSDLGDESNDTPNADDAGERPPAPAAAKAIDVGVMLALNAAVAERKLSRAKAINIAAKAFELEQDQAKQLIDDIPREAPKVCDCGSCGTATKAAAKLPPLPYPTEATVTEVKAAIAAFADKQRADILKQIAAVAKSLDGAAIVTKDDDDRSPFSDLPRQFTALDDWNDDLAYRIQPLIEVEAKKSADGRAKALTRVGASPDVFAVVPQKLERYIDARALRLAASTNATTLLSANDTLKALKQEIEDGVFGGDTVAELTERVQTIFATLSDARAETIARTETSAAVHMGQVEAAKASKIVSGFKYLVSEDACPICGPYADQEVSIKDYDDSGALDAEGVMPLHPNCRCTLTEIIDLDALGDDDNE